MTKQDYINAISHMSQSDPEAGRRCSPMTEHPTRAELTAAIAALLDKADYCMYENKRAYYATHDRRAPRP
mgnify:CR=1 FL=1